LVFLELLVLRERVFLLLLSSSLLSAGLVEVRVRVLDLELDEDFRVGLVVALP